MQQQYVDFDDSFSPVARLGTFRIFLALGAHWKWPIYQLNVKSAFLNGELSEEVYVQQQEGFIIVGDEEKVYKLKRALYGFKQAHRAWYKRIDQYFLEYGF